VVSSTIRAASVYAAGQAAAGVVSANAAALTEGVLKSMLLTKLKLATAVLLGVFACVAGGTVAFLPSAAGHQGPLATVQKATADDKKTDKDKLQGKWVPESVEFNGNTIGTDDQKVREKLTAAFGFWKLTFDGDNVIPDEGEKLQYKLDQTKKPKEIDLELGGNVGTVKAIYEFDGDKLKMSWIRQNDRPADFDTSKSKGFLVVLEKQK